MSRIRKILTWKVPKRVLCGLALAIVLFLVYVLLSNKHVGVTWYTIESTKIDEELDGFRIVQISDLHNARFGAGQKRLLEKVRACKPDLIALTGDIVDDSGIDAGVELVEGVTQIAPVFFVSGNHEYKYMMDADLKLRFFTAMEKAGVQNIDYVVTNFPSGLSLVGGIHTAGKKPSGDFSVLLAHDPLYMESYAKTGADLVLTGHIHGGQVRIPFVGGLISPSEGFFPKYYQGVHTCGETTMVISRGLGNYMGIPRVFNDPELVCVELRRTGSHPEMMPPNGRHAAEGPNK